MALDQPQEGFNLVGVVKLVPAHDEAIRDRHQQTHHAVDCVAGPAMPERIGDLGAQAVAIDQNGARFKAAGVKIADDVAEPFGKRRTADELAALGGRSSTGI